MITFDEALKRANEHFRPFQKTVYKALENDECWIFYGRYGKKPELVVGSNDVMIFKNDGHAETFSFTSDRCYQLLQKSKKVYSVDELVTAHK